MRLSWTGAGRWPGGGPPLPDPGWPTLPRAGLVAEALGYDATMDPEEASDGVTLTEVLDGLEEEGYSASFGVDDEGATTCRACRSVMRPETLDIDGLRRLEGASDPADMAAVLAVRCHGCGALGAIVVRYGPEAGPGDAALLRSVDFERRQELDVAEEASGSTSTQAPPP